MRRWGIVCLLALGILFGIMFSSPNIAIGDKRCDELTSANFSPKLWHSSLIGDSPMEVGFFLSEDTYQCHTKKWHWGDGTPDEYIIEPAVDHRYQVPCQTWNKEHHILCQQWYSSYNYYGYVEERDSSGKKVLDYKNFTVTVNHEDYQIITGFDQREGVIVPNDNVQLSVSTGHAWSDLQYNWDWGDDLYNNTLPSVHHHNIPLPADPDPANPNHKYIVGNDFFCSDSVACDNYTGTVVVSTWAANQNDLTKGPYNYTWWETMRPQIFDSISDMRTFSVLMLDQSQNHVQPAIEVSLQDKSKYTQDQFIQQTQFRAGDILHFWIYQPHPDKVYHLSGNSNFSFTGTSGSTQIQCSLGNPWNMGDNAGCSAKCSGYTDYNITCYSYKNPGIWTVSVTVQTGNHTYEKLQVPITIVKPAITVTPTDAFEGSTVKVSGQSFPPNETIDLFWNGVTPSGSVVHVGTDGSFKNLPLKIPPWQGNKYTLCARSFPQKINETEAYFTIDEPSSAAFPQGAAKVKPMPLFPMQGAANVQSMPASTLLVLKATTNTTPNPILVLNATTSTTASLSWSATPHAANYTLYRSFSPNGNFSMVAPGLKATNYTDINITSSTKTYYYLVTANNSTGFPISNSDLVLATNNNCMPPSTEPIQPSLIKQLGEIPIKHG